MSLVKNLKEWRTTLLAEQPTMDYAQVCINKQLWKRALRILRAMQMAHLEDLSYWKQRTLAELLCGNLTVATSLFNRYLTKCEGYSETDCGDFYRDVLLYCVRNGTKEGLLELLEGILIYHKDSADRLALWYACAARVHYALGEPKIALEFHQAADRIWDDLEHKGLPFTRQWGVNDQFHAVRTHLKRGEELASQVIATDPSSKRRLRGQFLRLSGVFLKIDEAIARAFRLS